MDEDTQSKFANLKAMHETLENLQEHVQMIERQRAELQYVGQSLDDISIVEDGTEILVQLASGIFVPAKITAGQKLRVNIGADIVVDKSASQTKEIVQEQITQLADVHQRLTLQLAQLADQFENLRGELQDVQVSKE